MKNFLKTIRRQKNLTINQVCRPTGISTSMWSMAESGSRTPSLETAIKMARVLGVGLDDIFLPSDSTLSAYVFANDTQPRSVTKRIPRPNHRRSGPRS